MIQIITTVEFKNNEVILIEDGSTDKSGDICDSFAKENNNVKVIHHENHGLATSKQNGVANAVGRYITFVNSDDYISTEMLCILYNNVEEFDMIECGSICVINNKKYVNAKRE